MTKRSVTDVGLLSIGRQIRGEALDRDVFLTLTNAGLVISPRSPGQVSTDENVYIAKFDQYNRISIPSKLRQAANIKKRVDVSLVGQELIVTPITDVCVFCGIENNLTSVSDGKFICAACRKTMIQANRKKGE